MDERRDPEPDDGTGPPVIAAGGTLTPAGRAWSRYVTHALACSTCRDIEQRCDVGDTRFRAWKAIADDAMQQLRRR